MDKYNKLVSKGQEAYLNALNEIGWFEISNNSKEEIEKRLSKTNKPTNYLFSLYDLGFDGEGFENPDVYEYLLNEIWGIVGLDIVKMSVFYARASNSIEIEVQTKLSSYTRSIELNSDWIEDNFIEEFVNNQILAGENINKKFFELPTDDQCSQYIFVTQSVYDKAIELGVIPDDLGFFYYQEQKEEKIKKLCQEIEKYKQETLNDPEDDMAFNNVGYFLYELYSINHEENTMRESCRNFEKAVSLNPNNDYALGNWSVLLYRSGQIQNDKNLIKEGIELCKKAYAINKFFLYNLACGYAMINDKATALSHLKKSLEEKIISAGDVKNDEDWKDYLSDEDFLNTVNA